MMHQKNRVGLPELCRKKPVLAFFTVTFCFSWTVWIPMIFVGREIFLLRIIGTYGPATAALLLTGINGGFSGIVKLLKPFRVWRVSIVWYLFCFLSTAVLALLAIGIYLSLDREELVFNDPRKIYLVIPVFFYVLIFSVLGEETGWRGFALPNLQQQYGALKASVIIGLIWGFWHLPLFLIKGNFHQEIPFWLFILQDVALSIVITWIYSHTGGSLLLIHFFHAASNTTLGVLPVLPMDTGGDLLPLYILCGFLGVLVLGIILSGSFVKPTAMSVLKTE